MPVERSPYKPVDKRADAADYLRGAKTWVVRPFYKPGEIASLTGYGHNAVRTWIDEGQLKGQRNVTGKQRIVMHDDLATFLAKHHKRFPHAIEVFSRAVREYKAEVARLKAQPPEAAVP